ncbi:MAG: 3-deoxy-D-manno-octulosonic-acid transferase [Rhodocyclaceae bacterium]|nr:MAG: 3-deoxy-D-manno-octulosonic-acid transferase [Rhodocyclaceae bacterium]
MVAQTITRYGFFMKLRHENPPVRSVNAWVDAVYVLTVKSSFRIDHIQAELAKNGIAFTFMLDHDAAELDSTAIDRVFGPSCLKRAHQSLVMKNIQVWKDSVTRGYRRVLVFEDDAVLSKGFAAGFDAAMKAAEELPPGWMVFLGGLDTKVPDSYFMSKGPLVELPIPTAEACVYDLLAMQRRLKWLDGNPVTLSADHLMCQIDAATGTPQYWLRHPVVEQGSVTGIFDSLLDGSRQKHSRTYNILRNRWNIFRRRQLREWIVCIKSVFA